MIAMCVMLLSPLSASAECGGDDYSWGADALSNAHDFTVTMILYGSICCMQWPPLWPSSVRCKYT